MPDTNTTASPLPEAGHVIDEVHEELLAEPQAITAIPEALREFLHPLPVSAQCEVLLFFMGTYLDLEHRRTDTLCVDRLMHPPVDWPWLTTKAQFDWAAEITLYQFESAEYRGEALGNLATVEQEISSATTRVARAVFKERVRRYVPSDGPFRQELDALVREVEARRLSAYGAMCGLLDICEEAHLLPQTSAAPAT